MKSVANGNCTSKRILIALLFLVAFAFCMVPSLYAKYTSAHDSNVSATVAKFSVAAGHQYSSSEIVFGDIAPGELQHYTFSIDSESEVRLKCSVVISSTHNLPINFSITSTDVVVNYDGVNTAYYFYLAPNYGEVSLNLLAEWPSNLNSTQYLGEIDTVRLTVTAEQALN